MSRARPSTTPARARVLIADDHALMRNGVANLLNQEADLEVVAEAADGEAAVEAFARHLPDVTLVDLRMPRLEGVEVVRRIREAHPGARLIILTTYDTDEDIDRALQAGARAYLLKDVSAEDLLACIRAVLRGETYVAPAVAARLAERGARVQLTPRELGVLRELAVGRANKEIAAGLGISEGTVKVHLAHLFDKLGVSSRTEAMAVAVRRGLVRL
ncbi:MAG: response regulator [Vicinamibacteria bacterium]